MKNKILYTQRAFPHRKIIRQKGRQSSSLLSGGRTWMLRWPFSNKDDLKKGFWKNIHFGRLRVWCSVNHCHPFSLHIRSAKCVFSYSSFSSNHSGANPLLSVVPPAATTFPFPSVWFLFYAFHLSIMRTLSPLKLFNKFRRLVSVKTKKDCIIRKVAIFLYSGS